MKKDHDKLKKQNDKEEFQIKWLDPEYSQHMCPHDIEAMGQVVLREKIAVDGEIIERKMYCANCDKFLKNL